MNHTLLSRDSRPIYSIFINGDVQRSHQVERWGVTKIVAVDEAGQMAHVPWFEVWKGDLLFARINGAYVSDVYYQEGQ